MSSLETPEFETLITTVRRIAATGKPVSRGHSMLNDGLVDEDGITPIVPVDTPVGHRAEHTVNGAGTYKKVQVDAYHEFSYELTNAMSRSATGAPYLGYLTLDTFICDPEMDDRVNGAMILYEDNAVWAYADLYPGYSEVDGLFLRSLGYARAPLEQIREGEFYSEHLTPADMAQLNQGLQAHFGSEPAAETAG